MSGVSVRAAEGSENIQARHSQTKTYTAAVAGLCRLEDPRGVLREMATDGLQASPELRDAMLHDARIEEAWARIEEAWALEEAIQLPETGKVVELVDKLLSEWEPGAFQDEEQMVLPCTGCKVAGVMSWKR
ncbi:uncharacterized protein LOC120660343 [Panicum virgatum]|uniref:uncharacterized protein LOC120660343 n=1 Tax=Panicum virgatum TaxID=38727 RepID=UPI0019D51997|nr:uncharacterized protein LOC120660343 [Panicum virgatum]